MPTVMPSQIVKFIDTAMTDAMGGSPHPIQLSPRACGALSALLRLIKELPNALLPTDPLTYSQFVQSQESIRFAVKKAQAWEPGLRSGPPQLMPDGDGKRTQVHIIREALAACPDQVPPQHSEELPFIKDTNFREALLIDLEAARSALIHGEWKAAAVLAGALVESLLLWAIQEKPSADIQTACSAAVVSGRLHKTPQADPLSWGLHQFVEVAEELKLIEPDTATETRLAKDFRNLIHPGRAIRLQQFCDRGTALIANAAFEHVSRDLSVRFQ